MKIKALKRSYLFNNYSYSLNFIKITQQIIEQADPIYS